MARANRQKTQQSLPHIKPAVQPQAKDTPDNITIDKNTRTVITAALSKYRASITRAQERERNDAYGAELRKHQLQDIDRALVTLGIRLI